jgi:hypothetical protein
MAESRVVNTDGPILCLDEAAALLRVSPDWLQRSTCPRCKVGGIVRWDRETCLAWMRAHVTKAAA